MLKTIYKNTQGVVVKYYLLPLQQKFQAVELVLKIFPDKIDTF